MVKLGENLSNHTLMKFIIGKSQAEDDELCVLTIERVGKKDIFSIITKKFKIKDHISLSLDKNYI